jgi:hypothetical protein
LERWDGRSDVLVLGFGVGFEGASSGSAGLCSFQAILWLISGGPVCGLCVWLVWRCVILQQFVFNGPTIHHLHKNTTGMMNLKIGRYKNKWKCVNFI